MPVDSTRDIREEIIHARKLLETPDMGGSNLGEARRILKRIGYRLVSESILQPGQIAVSREDLRSLVYLLDNEESESGQAAFRIVERYYDALTSPAADQPKTSCPEFPDN